MFDLIKEDVLPIKKKVKIDRNRIKEMQQCFGPTCDYNPTILLSPTGFTWKALQEHREDTARKIYALKGIFDIVPEMLLDKPVPTYEKFKLITSKEVKR